MSSQLTAPLPLSIITAARTGWDGFIRIQQQRLSPSSAPHQQQRRCVASHQYYERLSNAMGASFSGTDADPLWGMVTGVLTIVERGPQSRTCDPTAASMYMGWYHSHFAPRAEAERELYELRQASPAEMLSRASHVADTVLRTFLSGHTSVAAHMFLEVLQTMRAVAGGLLTSEVESCFGDIVRLMGADFTKRSVAAATVGKDEFLQWRAEASSLTERARYQIPQSCPPPESDAVGRWLQLAMSILVMMDGDVPTMLMAAGDLMLGAHGFTATLCTLLNPFATLDELQHLMESAAHQVKRSSREPWYIAKVVPGLLGCTQVTDVIKGLADMIDVAVGAGVVGGRNLISSPSALQASEFELCYLAAHVADLCMPSVLPSPADAELLFLRNDLVSRYVTCIQCHPATWSIAVGYLAASPLINPQTLRQLTEAYIAPLCTVSESALFQWEASVLPTLLDASQVSMTAALRAAMRSALPHSPEGTTLSKWLGAWDASVQRCIFIVEEVAINSMWRRGQFVKATEFAVRHSHCGFVQSELQHSVSSRDALQSTQLLHIGQAVRNGTLSLSECGRSVSTCSQPLGAFPSVAALQQSQRAPGSGLDDSWQRSATTTPLLMLLRFSAAIADVAHVVAPNTSTSSTNEEGGTASRLQSSFSALGRGDVTFMRGSVPSSQRLASASHLLTLAADSLHIEVVGTLLQMVLVMIDTDMSADDRASVLVRVNVAANRLLLRLQSAEGTTSQDDVARIRAVPLAVLHRLAHS